MKRSEINMWLLWATELLNKVNFVLPSFSRWRPEEWKQQDISVIRETMLGWDITDFGSNDFKRIGSVLFTIRNGRLGQAGVGTPYAEKVILVPDGGRLPLHFHETKTEDIINRGGGTLWLQLYNAGADNCVDKTTPVTIMCDGMKRVFEAGEIIEIPRGNSITLTPRIYHVLGAKDGDLVAGEVSSVNDDTTDNYFAEPVSRFAKIEEDVPARYPLCNEYWKL